VFGSLFFACTIERNRTKARISQKNLSFLVTKVEQKVTLS